MVGAIIVSVLLVALLVGMTIRQKKYKYGINQQITLIGAAFAIGAIVATLLGKAL